MGITMEQVHAGQAVYAKRALAVYAGIVLGISNRLVWQCPTRRLEDHYDLSRQLEMRQNMRDRVRPD